MAEESATVEKKVNMEDDLDGRIAQARKAREAMEKNNPEKQESLDNDKDDKSSSKKVEDELKMEVERSYITSLRNEAKETRKEKEKLQNEINEVKLVLKEFFQVDSPQALKEKLEETKRSKEKDDESRLSKIEVMEKKFREIEKQREIDKISYDEHVTDLKKQRDKIIIENALINEAIYNDVANPKQLLRLLQNEFYVDPDRLTPMYDAEDGPMTLKERVKIFLDDPENWNLVKSKIGQGSGSSNAAGSSSRPVFTKAELSEMRKNRPKEYKERQKEIQDAYKEGRVV